MNKIIATLIIFFSFLNFSCQKKLNPLTNSIEADKILEGSWKRLQTAEMDVFSNQNDPDSLLGSAKAKNIFILEFNSDLTYSMRCEQIFDSFVQTADSMPYTFEDIKENLTYNVTVKGNYSANDTKFQLNNKTVLLKDGNEISVEDYSKFDNTITSDIVESFWSVEDNVLTITSNNGQLVSVYKRM